MLKRSPTLEKIVEHWKAPKAEDGSVDLREIEKHFNLKNFAMENDQLLSLLAEPPGRKLFAKQTILENIGPAWVVFQGEMTAVKRDPIAWFKHTEDMNRFIFVPDERKKMNEEIERLKFELDHEIEKLGACVKALEMYAMTNETFPEYGDVAREALAMVKVKP